MTGFSVDLSVHDHLAGTLTAAADAIDAVDVTAIEAPNVGELSGLMTSAISHHMSAAAEYATGLGAAADAIRHTAATYAHTDNAAADHFHGLG
jgi:hypothetical protein